MNDRAPSGFALERVMSAYQRGRARIATAYPDLDEDGITALLGPETSDIERMQTRLMRGINRSESLIKATKEERADIEIRKERFERQKEMLRSILLDTMFAIGSKREVLPNGTVSVVYPKQTPRITDKEKIPELYKEYETVTTVVCKIREAELFANLNAGEVIDGAELSNGIPHLQIRSK